MQAAQVCLLQVQARDPYLTVIQEIRNIVPGNV